VCLAHDHGDQLKITENPLEKRELDLQGMFERVGVVIGLNPTFANPSIYVPVGEFNRPERGLKGVDGGYGQTSKSNPMGRSD